MYMSSWIHGTSIITFLVMSSTNRELTAVKRSMNVALTLAKTTAHALTSWQTTVAHALWVLPGKTVRSTLMTV